MGKSFRWIPINKYEEKMGKNERKYPRDPIP